jgi:hypothetical protein
MGDRAIRRGDGGAHVAMIVDASAPTYMLTHWRATGSAGRACRSNTW